MTANGWIGTVGAI